MKQKTRLPGLLGISGMLLIFAALPLFASGKAETKTEQGPVTIEMWTHDALYIKFFKKRVEGLNAKNPNLQITLNAQQMPDPITAFVSARVAGEKLPDMLGVEQGMFPILMKGDVVSEVLVDLTDRIGNRYNDFVQGRWALYTQKNRIYGVESALTASAYYYQPAIFEKYGLSVPKTWDEFLKTGKVLGSHGVSLGIMDNDSSGLFAMMFLQRGGQFFDKNENLVFGEGKNREYAIEVLKALRQALDENALYVVLGNEFWGSTIPTAFSKGRVAGIVAPDWYNESVLQPGVKDMAGKWRVAPMPVWGNKEGYSTSVWGGTGFAISRSSKHIDVVWDIINDGYMTLDGQLDRYRTIGFFPTMYKALDDPAVTEKAHPFFGGQKIGAVFSKVARDTPPLWQSPARPFLLQALVANLARFAAGEIGPEEFIDNVVQSTKHDAAM